MRLRRRRTRDEPLAADEEARFDEPLAADEEARFDEPLAADEEARFDEPLAADEEARIEPILEEEPALGEESEPEAGRAGLRHRLAAARGTFSGFLASVVTRGLDDAAWDELEEALILADAGVGTTTALLDRLREQAKRERITDAEALVAMFKAQMVEDLGGRDLSLNADGSPAVWLFVGVNGVGKTTTIGKLAFREARRGRKAILAAGDTFRAAAAEQLGQWAARSEAELVRGAEGADPSSVIYDAIEHAFSTGVPLVMADTAGRLHTRTNLMEELAKIHRVAGKGPGTVTEVLLVIDASTGQNGLAQARRFTETAELTGVVLTKLDGSAKGGIVLAVQDELDIPVKLVGLGEGIGDLVEFDAGEFVEALFS